MNEMLLLGAGASVEAGINNAYKMTKEMLKIIEDNAESYSGNPDHKKEFLNESLVLNEINNLLVENERKQESDPSIDCIDFELLYNALLTLEDKDSSYISSFVENWHPKIESLNLTNELLDTIRLRMKLTLEELTLIKDAKKLDYLKPILKRVNSQKHLAIANLNYDNAIELLAEENSINCETGIEEWNETGQFNFSDNGIKLLKLHGSVYWKWSKGVATNYKPLPHNRIRFVRNLKETLQMSVLVETPMVIYGHQNKLTTDGIFLDLLRIFDEELSKINLLTVIGYSFRDSHINYYISKYLNADPNNKIRIVDPNFESSEVKYIEALKFFRQERPYQIEVIEKFTGAALKELYK